jgi:ribosome production factor 2
MSQKYDASLFMLISNSRKRPNSVTLGRMFDHHLLDMVELQLVDFKPASHFKVTLLNYGISKLFVIGRIVPRRHKALHRTPRSELRK